MTAKVSFEVDVTNMIDDENLTIPEGESIVEKIVIDSMCNELTYPENLIVTIE